MHRFADVLDLSRVKSPRDVAHVLDNRQDKIEIHLRAHLWCHQQGRVLPLFQSDTADRETSTASPSLVWFGGNLCESNQRWITRQTGALVAMSAILHGVLGVPQQVRTLRHAGSSRNMDTRR